MDILVHIDQREALRQGIDAPQSTALIPITPSDLSQEERDELAGCLKEGFDASHKISLLVPSTPNLREILRDRIERRNQEEQERIQSAMSIVEEQILSMELGDTTLMRVRVDRHGEDATNKPWNAVVWRKIEVPVVSATGYENTAPADRIAARDRLRQEAIKRREAYIEEALADIRQYELPAFLRMEEDIQDEYGYYYNRLPELMRQRRADGYAGQQEIHNAIRALAADDAGLTLIGDEEFRPLDSATDEQYLMLMRFREALPDNEFLGGRQVETDLVREIKADPEYWTDSDGESLSENELPDDRCEAFIVVRFEVGGVSVLCQWPAPVE